MRVGTHNAKASVIVAMILAAASARGIAADDVSAPPGDRLTRLAEQFAGSAPAEPAAAPVGDPESLPLASRLAPASDVPERASPPRPTWRSGWVLNTATALGAVIVAILALRGVLARWVRGGGTAGAHAVEVLSRTPIAARQHVTLLRIGGRILICGESPGGLRTLSEITDPDEIATLLRAAAAARPHSITRSFGSLMRRFDRSFDEAEGGDDAEHLLDRTRDGLSTLLSRVRTLGNTDSSERGRS